MNFVGVLPGRHIYLASDDRMDSLGLGGLIKIHRAVHGAVVGNGHRGRPLAYRRINELIDPAGAVQQAVFGMQM